MNKLTFFFFLLTFQVFGQSFHSAPGTPNTHAIKKDSSCFVGWATGGIIQRGYLDISDPTFQINGSNLASFGTLEDALGPATSNFTDAVSLGDSGIATLTFDLLIMDGPGYDFAVFENGFQDNYLELGHVEVSSDGIHFFRFPSTTEIQTSVQVTNGSFTDCRLVNNLAGKYRVGYGTPFDLAELPNDPNLDKQAVQYIRIIDAIGAVSGMHYTTDDAGTIINDPFPTPFESGGFDLEAIGIINGTLGLNEWELLAVEAFPNPTSDQLHITLNGEARLSLYSAEGRLLFNGEHMDSSTIFMNEFTSGVYILTVTQHGKQRNVSILKK